jgi:Lambda phage tail tape-measure protein (Tape_meas_lam_C)
MANVQNSTVTQTLILDVDAAKMKASLDAAERELGQLATQFDKAQAAGKSFQTKTTQGAANFNKAITRAGKSSARSGQMMQQAGYQVSDFIVQVQGGTSAFRAFGQQGNQLFGMMGGPWGIALSLGALAVGVFGTALFDAKDDAKGLDDGLKGLAQTVDELTLGKSDKEIALRRQILNAQAEQAAAQVEINDLYAAGLPDAAEISEIFQETIGDQQDLIDGAQKQLAAIAKRREYLERELAHLEDIRGTTDGLAAATEANAEWLKTSADSAGIMANNILLAARGAKLLSNIRSNPDFFDPRGESRGAGNTDYSPPPLGLPSVVLPPNPRGDNAPGGAGGANGGSSAMEKAADDLEKYNEEIAKAIAATDQFGESMERSLVDLGANAMDSFVDTVVDGLAAGKLSFKEFSRAILIDLAKITLRAALASVLMNSLGLGGTPGNAVTLIQKVVQAFAGIPQVAPVASAKGNVFSGGDVVPFAKGGVVTSATLFPMSGGKTGLMGEAGPEAIVPLQRNSKGDLGMGQAPVNITINNSSGSDIEVNQTREGIEIAVSQARKAVEADFTRSMSTGQGAYARSLEMGYAARRKAV